DAAIAALAHARHHRMAHIEAAGEVDVDHVLPALARHLVQHAVAGDAGIVDQHVDRPDLVRDLLDAALTGFEIGDIPFIARNAGVLREVLGVLAIAEIGGGDAKPRFLEHAAGRLADARYAARDHGGSLLLSHIADLFLGRIPT